MAVMEVEEGDPVSVKQFEERVCLALRKIQRVTNCTTKVLETTLKELRPFLKIPVSPRCLRRSNRALFQRTGSCSALSLYLSLLCLSLYNIFFCFCVWLCFCFALSLYLSLLCLSLYNIFFCFCVWLCFCFVFFSFFLLLLLRLCLFCFCFVYFLRFVLFLFHFLLCVI